MHTKTVCSVCKAVVAQCRCVACDKHVVYVICDKCKPKEAAK